MPPLGGVMVEFREEGTNDLLWKAIMQHLPRMDESTFYGNVGGALTEYKVEGVSYTFRKPVPSGTPDPPGEATPNCQYTPIITVSEV